MQQLPDATNRKIALLIGERAERETLLDFTAVLALRGPVRILDASNSFDPYHVSRAIRRQTAQLHQVLARVSVARAFTCYQVITLLQETPSMPMPHLVFDLLATFYDQAVSHAESYRLLQIAAGHLLRLGRQAPVIVSVRPTPQGGQPRLLQFLQRAADLVLLQEAQPVSTLETLF
ncbi:MAG: hypothetical protein GWP61_10520 [Chloroflexi bacterium]|jgi:hypothetical protein|nr:hypothetical protein [Chloroflexota bacterium]